MKMELVELLEKFVSFNTVSDNSNEEMAVFLANYLSDQGFEVKPEEVLSKGVRKVNLNEEMAAFLANYTGVKPEEVLLKEVEILKEVKKINLIAKKGTGKERLMLAGHMDTVPPEGKWIQNPFKLTRLGDKYYGLGVADMKLFLATAIKAAEQINENELKHSLLLVFTHSEEIGLLGAKELIKSITMPEFGIIGEPTEMLPCRTHKGYMNFRITVKGKSGHGSIPIPGSNAIERAAYVILELRRYAEELKSTNKNPLFYPEYATLNIGYIKGGKKSNMVPSECTIECEIRPLPGQDFDSILQRVEEIVEILGEIDRSPAGTVRYPKSPTLPMETPEDSLIVRVVEEITGEKARGISYTTEGTKYNEGGAHCIILGPGCFENIHQPNEYVEAKWVSEQTIDVYTQIIRRICCE